LGAFTVKFTPLSVESSITPKRESTTALAQECPTSLPSAPTRPTIPPASFCIALLRWDFDAKFGSPQFCGNLLIEQTAHSKRQYFAFAWRQRGVPRTLFSNLSLALSICTVAPDGLVNRIEQRRKTVWSETQPHRPHRLSRLIVV
jgi:hypothetical protein